MKTEVLKTEHYCIEVNLSKNRIYFAVLAKWSGIKDFENFEEVWIETAKRMKPNFTIHSDLRLMPKLNYDIEALFGRIQSYLIENGLIALAETAAVDDISNLQIHRLSERNQMPVNKFKTEEEAENYLDQLVANLNM
ncbi:hypothetical protein V9L05_20200 [Bernardetia sp. Wsw4-3y2]|uniref:hypothetical protein n=1 Tax=unclassified Bernardetia TaxID=2647129 RepID=UPI0030D39934